MLSGAVKEIFADASVSQVIVYQEELLDNSAHFGKPISTDALSGSPCILKNVKRLADEKGATSLYGVQGDADLTISLSGTERVYNYYTQKFGASSSLISAAVGWDIAGISTITASASFAVPPEDHGKQVDQGLIDFYPIYAVKSYDVYKVTGSGATLRGTGIAKKVYGAAYVRKLTYRSESARSPENL